MASFTRKSFLKTTGLVAAGLVTTGGATVSGLPSAARARQVEPLASEVEQRAQDVLSRISPPTFPAAIFDVTQYGAVGDAITDTADAFRKAIADCASAGGGTVLVPPGTFFIRGSVWLRGNNTRLHLRAGATLQFSGVDANHILPDPDEYPLLDGQGERPLVDRRELMSLIFGHGLTNVGVTGEGPTSLVSSLSSARACC